MPSLKAPASRLGSPKLALIFATAVTGLLSGPQAHAITKIWKVGGNGNWSNGGNWTDNIGAVAGDILSFGGAQLINTGSNLAANTSFAGLLYTNSAENSTPVTNSFTTTGNTITLGGNITTTASSLAITDTLAIGIILDNNRTVTTGTGHNLTLSGALSGATFGITKDGGGTLTLSGGASNTYTGLTTVSAGTLELNKSGAFIAIAGGLTINTGGTVQYNASAGSNQITNQAVVTVAGGTLDMNNKADLIGKLIYNSGTISNVSGPLVLAAAGLDNLSMRDTTINFAVSINSNGTGPLGVTFDATNNGTATINGDINININAVAGTSRTFTINNGTAATDMLINGVIKNTVSGGVIKAGAGTLALTNTNTYTGETKIDSGKLIINGSISTSTLTTVNNGGTLGGVGTVGALTVASGGTLAPGESPGILYVGNTDLQTGSNLNMELNGATAGTGYDQLNVTGTVTLAGALNITMSFTPANDSLFFILLNDGSDPNSGTFSNASVDGGTYTLGGQQFKISYFGQSGVNAFTGGNDVVLMAIPEPAAALLGGLGLLTLLRRRRQN